MTTLTKPISRLSAKKVSGLPVVVTLAPCGGQDEALIGLRLLGQRTQYLVKLSDLYRVAALWHGQREVAAKREARRAGVPWRQARKTFIRLNSIPVVPPSTQGQSE